MLVMNESRRGISGLSREDDKWLVPSPMIPIATLIANVVPRQYDMRNQNALAQELKESAGANDGAPSNENPWRSPFTNTALLVDGCDTGGDVVCEVYVSASRSPSTPMAMSDKPTPASLRNDNARNAGRCGLACPLRNQARPPMNVAVSP
jgi:hypothetical protein